MPLCTASKNYSLDIRQFSLFLVVALDFLGEKCVNEAGYLFWCKFAANFLLLRVLIFTLKAGAMAKKASNTYTYWEKPMAQVVFMPMNLVIQFLALKLGYFSRMDLKPK